MHYLDLLNANVYLTNLLLVPSIIFSSLITRRIRSWSDTDPVHAGAYATTWLVVTCIFVVALVFSNVHHLYMFTKNQFLVRIGNIDSKCTAPLLAFLLLILNVVYIVYMASPCNDAHGQLKKMTIPIYIISAVLSLMGVLSYLVRRRLVRRGTASSSVRDKSIYITGHVFFHYTVYTGAMLLLLLFYVENKAIYNSLFARDSC